MFSKYNTEIPIERILRRNSLQVTEVKICVHVSHGKALPLILESLKNFGHDTNVQFTVFRPSHATRIASCATGVT